MLAAHVRPVHTCCWWLESEKGVAVVLLQLGQSSLRLRNYTCSSRSVVYTLLAAVLSKLVSNKVFLTTLEVNEPKP
jgi:hypothetical protein